MPLSVAPHGLGYGRPTRLLELVYGKDLVAHLRRYDLPHENFTLAVGCPVELHLGDGTVGCG